MRRLAARTRGKLGPTRVAGQNMCPMGQVRTLADLCTADPVLARLVDARPGFDPRAWLGGLPPMDAFSVLVFGVIGQQLSIGAPPRILERLQAACGGRLPTPAELLAIDHDALRRVGLSRRKVGTLRDVARRSPTEHGERKSCERSPTGRSRIA